MMIFIAVDLYLLAIFLISLYLLWSILLIIRDEFYLLIDLEDESEYEDEDEEQDYDDGNLIISPRDSNFSSIEEEEEDDTDDDVEDDEEQYEVDDAFIPVEAMSPTVSNSIFQVRLQAAVVIDNGSESSEPESGSQEYSGDQGNGRTEEMINRGGIDGLFCPICFDAWTSSGHHQICCLPCGHIYGLSCIKKWLKSSAKCPQCKGWSTLAGIRLLYATWLCVNDEELHKRVQSLEGRCANLEKKAVTRTIEELVDQICNNPTFVEQLARMIFELHEEHVSPP